MINTNIVKLAGFLIEDASTKTIRAVIADRKIEFFIGKNTKPDATATFSKNAVDNEGNVLTDGEYTISPSKVTRIGDVKVSKAAAKEKEVATKQDKTTRSSSPLPRIMRSGF